MARILGLFPAALTAARGGMSANRFYQELRSQGIAPRRSEALQLYKIARTTVSRAQEEPFRPQQSIPQADEMGMWPVKNPNGITQTVTLTYRDRTTGQIKQTWWSTVTPEGITREAAVEEAVSSYSDHADRYEQDLIGAVHTSSYVQVAF
jgi:hypothetical protein